MGGNALYWAVVGGHGQKWAVMRRPWAVMLLILLTRGFHAMTHNSGIAKRN